MASKLTVAQSYGGLKSLFNLLADPTRMQILTYLATGEHAVTDIRKEIGVAQTTVSHHLGLLRMNGLIVNQRQGRQVVYSLDDSVKGTRKSLKFSIPPFTVTVES